MDGVGAVQRRKWRQIKPMGTMRTFAAGNVAILRNNGGSIWQATVWASH